MSANYETAGVSATMQGVAAFIHRTQPLQDKPCSNQMADSWFLTAVISHFYSAV